MNVSVKLIILGLLSEREMHPYEIQQTLKVREMEHLLRFQKGSLYYAVEQLHKNGFIEISEILRETHRPEKTVYRINEAGRQEFIKLMKKNFLNLDVAFTPVYPALGFAAPSDGPLVLDLLNQRLQMLRDKLMIQKEKYQSRIPTLTRSKLYIFVSSVQQTETEIRWLESIRRDAMDGRLGEIGVGIIE